MIKLRILRNGDNPAGPNIITRVLIREGGKERRKGGKDGRRNGGRLSESEKEILLMVTQQFR